MYTNIVLFGERILPECHICDIGLSNNMARPMELRFCDFDKVFLVNHWHDNVNCNYKLLCLTNSYRCIGLKP